MEFKIIKPYLIVFFVILFIELLQIVSLFVVSYISLEFDLFFRPIIITGILSKAISFLLIGTGILMYFKTSILKKVKRINLREAIIVFAITVVYFGIEQISYVIIYSEEIAMEADRVIEFSSLTVFSLIGALVVAPIWEEILFRGPLNLFEKNKQNLVLPVIFLSLLFMAVHIDLSFLLVEIPALNLDPSLVPTFRLPVFIGHFCGGVIFSIIYIEHGLLHSMLSHFIFNLLATLVQYNLLF